ncbi:hypothetical protein A6279_25135 [Bacillus wiedmannii]|uniref:Uncharacterized protein n=1 Tax=Bacillus cereus TaxID=1396 RepID=A0A2A8ZPZ4_BACCE|nr:MULTISPECIES: hypothetical protein [Bacillus cereus group]OAK08947.1 hypothetical protein A6278_25560 [Bacillus wiedmannii]OAK09660.1 hypothetical protein A6279_25135 [Bacillus wiedmannii]PFE06712.1 hypothetical protein CN307_32650 [Bacillus cereus]PHG74399.1 hypothetical protein COI50_24625 [Bacillus wiedmannii]TKA00692.1 hypothetical protein FA950_26955 [Bacillus thuringiensis]
MSRIALDGNKTVYAYQEGRLEKKGYLYNCKNPQCSALLKIASINGVYGPYFTTKGTPKGHIQGCPYGVSNNAINTIYDDSNFDLEQFANKLFTKQQNESEKSRYGVNITSGNNQTPSIRPIKSVTQFYYFAKQHSETYLLGNVPLYKLLSDTRIQSKAHFSDLKTFNGTIIAEVIFAGYNRDNQQINVRPRFGVNSNMDLKFILHIDNEKIFNSLIKKILDKNKKPFVIFAKWDNTECKIYSQKQVVFPTIIN